nr:immunoglobulin heavy chain junction region [Mus musculus]
CATTMITTGRMDYW